MSSADTVKEESLSTEDTSRGDSPTTDRASADLPERADAGNPFFSPYLTPFGLPPFDRIDTSHYLPAFHEGLRRERAEIEAIASGPEAPTFANTLEALEHTGDLLDRVSDVFFNLLGTDRDDAMQEVAKEVVPLLARHRDDILFDEGLFSRIEDLWKRRSELGLDAEEARLLEETHRTFVRCGARLGPEEKRLLRQINEEISVKALDFGENVLAETNGYEMVLEHEDEVSGLPAAVLSAAREEAEERGHPGKWLFTLQKPSWIPFLQHSERRHLRERLYRAYLERADRGGEHDNNAIASRLAVLRARKARLLGHPTHAHPVLEESMAESLQRVDELLRRLWPPAVARARAEAEEMRAMIEASGEGLELQPWDWWYYAERIREQRFDLDEEALRPYFSLDNVRRGAFLVAEKLFGLEFEERTDLPAYHPQVRIFEVRDRDRTHLGLFLTDDHPRAGKRVGAWMNTFRDQYRVNGEDVRPLVVNVANLSPPASDGPALLSLDEVLTVFHEFGHALHGLCSKCRFRSLSGTRVPRDFVELPSQVMENWATEPEVLRLYARHHETGEPIPDELVQKLRASEIFDQGFKTVEYLAASFLDMAWHGLEAPEDGGELEPPVARELEARALEEIGLPPEILPRYRTPYFNHIFAGGYSSGYYSYIWAEVLDADAFDAFRETGDLFHPELARAFREAILAKGNTEPPMDAYRRFRGAEPRIEPLLQRRGLA
ncbi:MAG: M3 family metallopeptidase [Holophagales bacterium]|nr:M3 family metallopeptidase [Holophagales bacterium]